VITTLYAGLLAIFYVGLSFYVIHGRYRYKVGIGNGGDPALARRVRVHGNFAEYVPFALFLLFLVDYARASPVIVHGLGVMLLAARLLHMSGLGKNEGISFGRFSGTLLTQIMMAVCAVILLWKFVALRLAGF
jgi:uncharacterized membrane protein YecN with MAPEG domain